MVAETRMLLSDKKLVAIYRGARPNVCRTALDSAKQNSVTAYATWHFSAIPCKGGVTLLVLGPAPAYYHC